MCDRKGQESESCLQKLLEILGSCIVEGINQIVKNDYTTLSKKYFLAIIIDFHMDYQ